MRTALTRVAWVLLAAVLGAGLVFAFSDLRTPAQLTAESSPPEPSVVVIEARSGPLVTELELEGVLTHTGRHEIAVGGTAEGATRQVITALHVDVGDTVDEGDVLLDVSGRAIMLLHGQFPMYRDLEAGMSGADVDQARVALERLVGHNLAPTGEYNDWVAAAIRTLYRDRGLQPIDDGDRLPALEVVFVPDMPATVTSLNVDIGDDADGVLFGLAAGPLEAHVPLTGRASQLIDELDLWTFSLPGMSGITVGAPTISPAQDNDGEATPASAAFPLAGEPDISGDGQSIRVSAVRELAPPDSTIVPSAAVWTDHTGRQTVQVVRGDDVEAIPVSVIATVLGEAALVPGPVAAGDQIQLLPVPPSHP